MWKPKPIPNSRPKLMPNWCRKPQQYHLLRFILQWMVFSTNNCHHRRSTIRWDLSFYGVVPLEHYYNITESPLEHHWNTTETPLNCRMKGVKDCETVPVKNLKQCRVRLVSQGGRLKRFIQPPLWNSTTWLNNINTSQPGGPRLFNKIYTKWRFRVYLSRERIAKKYETNGINVSFYQFNWLTCRGRYVVMWTITGVYMRVSN